LKKLILFFAISIFTLGSAQIKDSLNQKKTYLKANAFFLPIGMLNAGVEHQISNQWTIQGDIFISPWKSFMGKYAQIYMMGFETRYYFNEAFKHWYVGANVSFARFIIQKYNYWNDGPYQYKPWLPVYRKSDLYQDGFGIMAGVTVGYQWQINENWNLELFVGGGHSESFYKGFHKGNGVRYDPDSTRKYNRSGEWIPYKGGLMVSYRIK
jgi:hypothetical protein